MANNLLVDWLNKKPNLQKANVQSVVNNNTASNAKNVTAPELKLGGVNLQKAQANVNAGGMVGAGSVAGVNLQNKPTLNTLGPGTKSNIVSNNPAFNNGQLVTQNNPSNRFIGFQQKPNVPNTVLETTPNERQGLNWQGMLNGQYAFVPSEVSRAEAKNAAEEKRFRTMSEAFYDLQGDLYNRGKILNDYEIKQKYPEFKNLDMSVLKELQNELLPIVKNGMGVDADQLSQYYPELLKGKELKDIDELKGKIEKGNEWYKGWENAIKKVAKGDVEGMSSEGVQSVQDAKTIRQMVQAIKKQGVVGGGSDYEILKALYEKDPEAKKLMDNFNSRELTEKDKAIWGREDANILRQVFHAVTDPLRKDDEFMKSDEELTSLTNKAKAMEDDYWGQVGGTARVGLRSTADTWEKFIYRMSQDAKLWTIEDIDEYLKQSEENERNVAEYNASVDRETENVAQNTINKDVRDYYNNHTMSRSLALGDVPGFFLQSTKSATENVDMPIIIAAGVVAPEVVLPLMATDTYVRESEGAFEELLKNGASYDDAEQGAVTVGIANTVVELFLEKALGGVETTASKAIRDALMKDISKKTTEMVASRGLTELLKQGAVTQFRSSLEEGLEEIVQQSIENYAVSKYNPDVNITDGLREAFEGGFFNPMNLLAGGGDIMSNIDVDAANQRAYNQGVKTRNAVDNAKNALNQGAYNAGSFLGNMTEDFKNSFTPGGASNNQGGQQQGTVNTTSENQNNINGQNYNQNTKNNKTLNSVQLGMLQNDNRMNPAKITEFKEKFGVDYGQALADRGYTESRETNVPKIEQDTKDIYNKKKEAMNAIEGEFQDRSLRDMLNIMIKKAKNTLDYDMSDKYQALKQKHNSKGLTMAEANDMREEFSYKVKTKWGGDGNSDKIDLANNVYTAVKNFLEKKAEEGGMKDLKQINRDIAMRKYLSTWIGDKAERQSANNMVSLTDWVILAEAVSNPYAAAGFAAKKIAQKPRVKNAVLNAVVGRRENRTIDTQNRQTANQERLESIEKANEGKRLQQELSKPTTPALPNGIKLTKVTEVDARKNNKPKNTVTKKSKSENNKKSDSSSNDDTNPPSGGTPTGNGPTNTNPKGTAPTSNGKNNVTQEKKAEPKKEVKAQPKQDKQEAKRQANVDIIKKYADEYGIERDEELAKNAPTMHGDLIKEFLTKTEGPITFEKHGDGEVAAALDTNLYKKNPQNLSNTFYVGGNKADMDFLRKINRPETENTKAYAKLFEVKEEPKNKVTSKKTEATTRQENKQTRKPREDQTRTELLYGDLEELGAKVEDADGNLTPIADVADKFTDYVHRVGMEKAKGEYDARNIAKAIKEYFDNHKIDDFYKKEVLRDDGVYRVEISDEALTDILNRTVELETGTKGDKKVRQITGKVTQGIIEEERKNKVTAKKTEATAPKQEENQTKIEPKPVENSELREKIGDTYYNYLERQLEIINTSRKDAGLPPMKIEDMDLTKYRDNFHKVAQEQIKKIQQEMEEATKDFPKAPALTEEQKKQLSGKTSQAERNKLLKKWQDEWIKKNPITDEQAARVEEIMDKAAKVTDDYNKAMNYLEDLEIEEENKETEDHYSEESKAEMTKNDKNKVTNPSKAKTTSLFNENEVDKGKELEGLNPDALPLSDYREMQRLKVGRYGSQWNALQVQDIKDYISTQVANEKVGVKPDRDDNEAWDKLPEDFEDVWGAVATDIEEMYDAYEEYLDMKNGGDTFDENTLKNTLESANFYANRQFPGKTAKEVIDQYTPQYEADLKIYNRLSKKYPGLANRKIDLTGAEGKARREFASQENETAQDIDYQELAERENETPQMPTIFEEDLEQMNLRDLGDNETPQTALEEMEKSAPKTYDEIGQDFDSYDTWAGTKSYYGKVGDGYVHFYKTPGLRGFTVEANPHEYELFEGVPMWKVEEGKDTRVLKFIDEMHLSDFLNNAKEKGLKQAIKDLDAKIIEARKAEKENKPKNLVTRKETKGVDAVQKFKDQYKGYDDTEVLTQEKSFSDPETGNEYVGTYSQYLQWLTDNPNVNVHTSYNGNPFAVIKYGDYETEGHRLEPIAEPYMKFLKDNPEIRENSAKKLQIQDYVAQRKEDGNDFQLESKKEFEEGEYSTLPEYISINQEASLPKTKAKRIAPSRIAWQQETYKEGVDKVFEQVKTIAEYIKGYDDYNNYRYALGEENRNFDPERYKQVKEDTQHILFGYLTGWGFKSAKSKKFIDLWKNITNAKDNESKLRDIAKNVYIDLVKKDVGNGYMYPQAIIDSVPGIKTAKDKYLAYIKGWNTSFSQVDARKDSSLRDTIGADLKRQDGKTVTEEFREYVKDGMTKFGKALGLDVKRLNEDLGLLYADLDGKNPFLIKNASGVYHPATRVVSVHGGGESFRFKNRDGTFETVKIPTTFAHELTHAIDHILNWSLFSKPILKKLRNNMNKVQNSGRGMSYWGSEEEITARMVQEYVGVKEGVEDYYSRGGYWTKEIFDSIIAPEVERAFRDKLGDYYQDPDTVKYQKTNLITNGKNNITSKQETKKQTSPLSQKELEALNKQMEQFLKTGLANGYKYHDSQIDFVKGVEMPARLQAVWHGSPADFDRFDSTHMSEGEGAQAHGRGHYVAVNEDTGRHYAEMKGGDVKYKGESMRDTPEGSGEKYIAHLIGNRLSNGKSFEYAKKYLTDLWNERLEYFKRMDTDHDGTADFYKKQIKKTQENLDILNKIKEEDFSDIGGRNLYQVEIPDLVKKDTPTGSNYLEEGEQISGDEAMKFIKKVKEIDKKLGDNLQDRLVFEDDGEYFTNGYINGRKIYDNLEDLLGSNKKASKFLESLGYDGIHYYGGRDGEAYVIFNDDTLDITDHIKYLKADNGDIAGAVTPDGVIHLILPNLRRDTAAHEFSHLLRSYAKKNSPELFNAINKIAQDAPQELKDYVKRTYGDLSEDAFLDEVFAWRQGQYSGIKSAQTWYQRMWSAIVQLWNNIKSKFGSKYANLDVFEAYQQMGSEELMKKVDDLLKGGKEIGQENEGDTRYQRHTISNANITSLKNKRSSGDGGNVEVYRGKINKDTKAVLNQLGIKGYYEMVVDQKDVNHLLNRHGKGGKYGVTRNDVQNIPDIMLNADSVTPGTLTATQNMQTIQFKKVMNGVRYVLIAHVSKRKKTIGPHTMWKKRA